MSRGSRSRPPADERIRFCLNCGEMIAYEAHVCSACGHYEPGLQAGGGPTRSCSACAAEVSSVAIWCPHCGDETGLVALPSVPSFAELPAADAAKASARESSPGAAGLLVWMLALGAPLLVTAALALTAFGSGAR